MQPRQSRGFTVLELLLAIAVAATMVGVGVAMVGTAIEEMRVGQAASYLEGRIMNARMQAVRRSAAVALRFEPAAGDYGIAEYVDGNGNGVRAADISAGVDAELAPRRLLADLFSGVSFGLGPDVPDVDGARTAGASDGVRVGTSRILTLGPDGTATSGTLYLRGTRSHYAVRILGATARTRVLRFELAARQWINKR